MSQPFFAPDDPAAPPRANGELVFAAPWESRVFGLAAALRERGLFSWDEFRAELIAAIDDEADHLNMLVGNLLADILLAWADPRIRLE